jgi:hypothetical protein
VAVADPVAVSDEDTDADGEPELAPLVVRLLVLEAVPVRERVPDAAAVRLNELDRVPDPLENDDAVGTSDGAPVEDTADELDAVDVAEAEKFARKMKSGKGFDLEDFRQQIGQMKKMGGLTSLLDKLPGDLAKMAQGAKVDDRMILRQEAIILSMTPAERAKPEILKASRKRRIASGAGVQVQDVNRLFKEYEQMRDMMKKMKGGGLMKMMKRMGGMGGMGGLGGPGGFGGGMKGL